MFRPRFDYIDGYFFIVISLGLIMMVSLFSAFLLDYDSDNVCVTASSKSEPNKSKFNNQDLLNQNIILLNQNIEMLNQNLMKKNATN